jgi:glutamate carboxypeptidase
MLPRAFGLSLVGRHNLRDRTLGCETIGDPVERLLAQLRDRTPQMLDALRALVETESPTADPGACAACADVADDLAATLLGTPAERCEVGGRVHLRWRFGPADRVLLIGHLDTVWPLGTAASWPFAADGETATGPGVFDMKAGVVQLLFALNELETLDGAVVLLTTDEEIGSPTSRELILDAAGSVEAALVLEPSAGGALKTERKGVAIYRLDVEGRAAHAGLDPESGVNAAVELVHQLLAVVELADHALGTTVNPGLVSAGTAANTVPAAATAQIDVRTRTRAEAERIDAAFQALRPVLDEAALTVERIAATPPLERGSSATLFRRAERLAGRLGLPALTEAAVGGGSDGNMIAACGVPTLDGLGAVGDHAHGRGEYVRIDAMAERAALVAALVRDLLVGGTEAPPSD